MAGDRDAALPGRVVHREGRNCPRRAVPLSGEGELVVERERVPEIALQAEFHQFAAAALLIAPAIRMRGRDERCWNGAADDGRRLADFRDRGEDVCWEGVRPKGVACDRTRDHAGRRHVEADIGSRG
jgi:hypothetical protein